MEVTMVLALREPQPMLEMNMTPLIDVLLVLIIMFIITVPIQTNAVRIDLPQKSVTPLKSNAVRNVLTIAPDGIARWKRGGRERRNVDGHPARVKADAAPDRASPQA